ncbi:MAG: nitrilase-related carbon-nitrogen hydrolase [Phycisphaerales bacterium]
MRIALDRVDALVGDPDGNALRLADAAERAVQAGAGCVAFPELAICGYPPREASAEASSASARVQRSTNPRRCRRSRGG